MFFLTVSALALLQPAVLPVPRAAVALGRSGAIISSLPGLPTVAAACLVPSCLGFIKSEWGVSYAYGTATLAVAALVLPAATSSVSKAHALALAFYGLRLNLFLLYRELRIPYFTQVRERIEARASARGGRLKRAPFIVSCALLYGCMCAPLFVTAAAPPSAALTAAVRHPFFPHVSHPPTPPNSSYVSPIHVWSQVSLVWAGFATAAFGDLTKTVIKSRKGEGHLVTEGVFRWLRHPNYTGEALGWGANVLAALVGASGAYRTSAAVLGASLFGLAGILYVLAGAATGLERKQREKYATSDEYTAWIKGSWAGPTIKRDD